MILHIFPNDKFAYDYIKRINELFDSSEHLFYVFGEKFEKELEDLNFVNVRHIGWYKMCFNKNLILDMLKSDKVIFHSLLVPGSFLVTVDLILPFIHNKCFWNIWGADLYNAFWERNDHQAKELLRRCFIRSIRAVGYIPGDYVFLKQHYKTKAKFYLSSYTYEFDDVVEKVQHDNCVNILLGNSATKESRYHEAIDMIAKLNPSNIKVFCVLSYPKENNEYRNEVISYGKKVLGEAFEPLTGFMRYSEYMKLLSSIDVAIFNHNRQQALGNIASLLFLGKRVFVNPQNACKEYFENIGAELYSTEGFTNDMLYKGTPIEIVNNNRKAILDFFSNEQFCARWSKIFFSNYREG